MNFSTIPILSIAISIVVCWSLFSLFCSFIQEALAQIKAERGRYMKKYLFKQFYDQPNGVNWASLLYLHGTIDLLIRDHTKPTSEIHPRLFAVAMIDVVANAHITQINKKAFEGQIDYNNNTLSDFKVATLSLQQSDVIAFFRQALATAELQAQLGGVRNEGAIYESLVTQLSGWYSQMMERLSLWYKKKVKLWLFIIGTVLALVINADSLQLYRHFSENPLSRKIMMDYYEANAARLNELSDLSRDPHDTANYHLLVQKSARELDSLAKHAELPVGWEYSILNRSSPPGDNFLARVLGFLLSGFAASAGAPFWFDLLRRTYSVRTPKNA